MPQRRQAHSARRLLCTRGQKRWLLSSIGAAVIMLAPGLTVGSALPGTGLGTDLRPG